MNTCVAKCWVRIPNNNCWDVTTTYVSLRSLDSEIAVIKKCTLNTDLHICVSKKKHGLHLTFSHVLYRIRCIWTCLSLLLGTSFVHLLTENRIQNISSCCLWREVENPKHKLVSSIILFFTAESNHFQEILIKIKSYLLKLLEEVKKLENTRWTADCLSPPVRRQGSTRR